MPIVITDFQWKQTDRNIIVTVPLRGVHPSKADILVSSRYVKVSFSPFISEILLLNPIETSRSKTTKTSSEIVFELEKRDEGSWPSLEVNLPKAEKLALKNQSIEEHFESIREACEARRIQKATLKKLAVSEQIELDSRTRNRIEEKKKNEEEAALGDLNRWKKHLERASSRKDKEKVVPKPRSTRSLQVLFSEREFPTPSRESLLEEEAEFLRKQAEAKRSAGFVQEDLRPEEKNPQYLLAKGKEFLSSGNFLGAISAFTFGMKLSPKFIELYVARSEAHLMAGNYCRAVDDCSNALELLKPALPVNLVARALCIGRRGVALCKLGLLKQGLTEFEASLRLKPNSEFEAALEETRRKLEEANCQ
ncbi:dynein axonemal assembly factor 4-like [Cylas formicarius]|uniref:dynein axonemal assembly factor 4-like n=1 Tax=Cylas formicarius TaxID=197179 RepID=UPI0029588962|nr:dynein axonemal assembly factor 4-like [Cylas formicarius]